MTGYSTFLYSGFIFLAGCIYFLWFANNKGLSPAFVFFPTWSISLFLFYYRLKIDYFPDDTTGMITGNGLSQIIISFAVCSFIGFVIGDLFVVPKKETYRYENISRLYFDADYIYETTGMLNITKLDMFYYGKNDLNTSNLNHIHLSMGHDNNYILLSLVTIASILNKASNNTYIHFHFVLIGSKYKDMKEIIVGGVIIVLFFILIRFLPFIALHVILISVKNAF